MSSNSKFSDINKDRDSNNKNEILDEIQELNKRFHAVQRSLALLFQLLRDKLHQAIIDAISECNSYTDQAL